MSVGGGHRPLLALLVVAHAVSGCGLLTAAALSVEALGRVVPGLDPRIDIGHSVTALGVSGRGLLTATASAVGVRVPMPVGECGAVVRVRTLSRIARVTARGQACDYLLPLPACGPWKLDGWPDVGPRRVWRRLSLSLLWPGAAAGVPPVLEGRPLPLSRLFFAGACQVLLELVWLLFPGGTWSLGGCDRFCSSVGGYRVSCFDCCWGGHFLCCDCDACWGWRFLPAGPGVSGDQQRQGVFRSRGRRSRSSGDGTDRRALSAPEEGLLLLTALRIVGGGAVALPQIRLRMPELTLLLPVPGMRLKVRILVALPGILTTRLVLGRRGLLQGLSLASLERVVIRLDLRVWRMLAPPLPSRGFAWREVAWAAFSRLWPLLVGREVRRSSSSRGSGPDSSTRFWALLYWGASAWSLLLG